LWAESARAGFGPLLPEGHPIPEFDRLRFRELIQSPEVRILLAEDAGGLLGETAFGSNRDADVAAAVGEIRAFFVRPAAWRRGVGRALMSAALAELRELGYAEATVWSFADNARANAFYEHHGFRRDGAERREEVWAGLLEVRYRLALP
jgi:GNAT superfamily N-acetyltransferase